MFTAITASGTVQKEDTKAVPIVYMTTDISSEGLVAEDHGFTAIADVDIQDSDGSMSIPVTGGVRLTENCRHI